MSRTTVEWIPPASSGGFPTYDLSSGSQGIYVLKGPKGFDAPTVQIAYDEMPGLDGAYLRHVRRESRELFLPLFLFAATRAQLLDLKRSLIASLDPATGPGRLKLTEADGSSRYIEVYCTAGPEGDEGQDQSGQHWAKMGLVFRAMDPFWYSGTTQTIEFTPGALNLKAFFADNFLGEFPLNSSHTLNGTSQITVTGDVDTWPVWYVHGPCTDVRFTRRTGAGDELVFSAALNLTADDLLVIDTRPGRKSVINRATGENLWPLLGPSPQLWPIARGANEVLIEVDDVSPLTAVNLLYTPRYLGA
ncbi:hypothetical protein [Nonomuraea zeae]|uniref:hypothetical protein n=1 Tax=Nonomuraea zeae TaxID=1642303 RepID=UPI00361ACE6D